ncbi:MAG TPA: SpoIID/LytB domain-containing protein, partial [Spirochaetota bacterium]|nr:SpoIID/LytB domain-containing protein [Spirochaetota bacterium]
DNFYFGKIQITPLVSGFEVINTIPIETYLLSVIPSEVPLSFPFEALKAQAVIARTYSYYFIEKYRNSRNFDVDNTIMYQVYNGFNIKTDKKNMEKLKKALFSTTNKILIHNDKPILAYFHSNSGGITRSGSEYFGKSSDFEYLKSRDDPYSIGEKNDKWDYSLDLETFKNKLGIKNEITEDLSENMFEKDSNAFVKKFIYKDVAYQTKEIRKKIGYFELKSERFKIKIEENNIIFSGIGFGHGVGLSQYGAKKMAELGFKYEQIVNFYYPKTQIVEIKE